MEADKRGEEKRKRKENGEKEGRNKQSERRNIYLNNKSTPTNRNTSYLPANKLMKGEWYSGEYTSCNKICTLNTYLVST